MQTFDTPDLITATIDIPIGDVRISTTTGGTTIVDVRPSDASNDEDIKAAGLTRVEYASTGLLVKGPKPPRLSRKTGPSIDVTIELPAGSHVRGTGQVADFSCDGRLGECRIKTALGHIRVDRADTLNLKSGIGDVSVEHATGHAEVTTASGDVRVRALDADAVIKNSNGDTWIGVAGGDVRVNAANGSITVDVAHDSVVARSSHGDVRLGEVVRGSVVLETRLGDLEVGIREGTAAWLDVSSKVGRIRNTLAAGEAPEPSTETVDVRARTTVGEIAIRRP